MKEIKKINHVGIRVSCLDKSKLFYEKLGFEFIAGPLGPEPVAIMVHPSGININFILNSTDKTPKNYLMDIDDKHTGYTHMALEVSDMDSIIDKLKKLEITISDGPINLENGTSMLFIRDPDLNVIEFNQPSKYKK
ncbi:VOC family protein [Francisella sp. SYW-9]|uniref:VOC family protein n=1 Tax=Francisella sp. SYW-9 TaxID=2610888 RepID=UPI00123D39D9|nr:VOC family protein [Francisella sp. SYW-9]